MGGTLMQNPIKINKEKLLLVEGKDEINFFCALINYLEITEVQILEVGGCSQFGDKFDALCQTTGFEIVRILAVIQDADNDPNSKFERIKHYLNEHEFELPRQLNSFSNGNPQIGVFILPDNQNGGMLEDLCLRSVGGDPKMDCVENFFTCITNLENPPRNIAKAKAQVFLAAMPEIANCVGIGACKRYWDFNSVELDELKSFLRNFEHPII